MARFRFLRQGHTLGASASFSKSLQRFHAPLIQPLQESDKIRPACDETQDVLRVLTFPLSAPPRPIARRGDAPRRRLGPPAWPRRERPAPNCERGVDFTIPPTPPAGRVKSPPPPPRRRSPSRRRGGFYPPSRWRRRDGEVEGSFTVWRRPFSPRLSRWAQATAGGVAAGWDGVWVR